MARRAARRRRRLPRERRLGRRSAAASRPRSPAPRRCPRPAQIDEALERSYDDDRTAVARDRAARARGRARSSARAACARDEGEVRARRSSCSSRARGLVGGPRLLRRRARGHPLPARRLPLQALEHRDRDRRCSTRRSSSPSAPGCRATCSARRSSTGARAATAASATSRPRARTSSARSSSPRASATARRWATSTSRPRSSPSARATGCSRARTPSARRSQYEEIADRAERRPAAEQPRRPQLPARQARGRGPVPEGRVRDVARRRQRRRRGARRLVARAGASPHRRRSRSPRSRRATRSRLLGGPRSTSSTRSATRSSSLGRALLEQGRLDEAEAAFDASRGELRPAFLGEPPCGGVDRPGRLAARSPATTRGARRLYRRAAETLQDFRF